MLKGNFSGTYRRERDDFANGRIHLSMGKHRNGAFVVGFTGVVMDRFVQRRTRRHRVQQQDNTHEHNGQWRLDDLEEMVSHVLQIIRI